jgi:hypothetical protein
LLPAPETAERVRLEREALAAGLVALEAEHGNLANALYSVHVTFRSRFLEERNLVAGGEHPVEAQEAILDARQLEAYVNDSWAAAIYALPRSSDGDEGAA